MKEKHLNPSIIAGILTFAVIAGALAGAVSSVVTDQSLEEYAQSLRDRNQFFRIAEEKPRPLPGTYEEALDRVREVGFPTVAAIAPLSEDSTLMSNWVSRDDVVGYGTVLTSDGWLLFSSSLLEEIEDPVGSGEVWIQRERYAIERVVEGVYTDLVLVKINANGLSTLAFGRSENMEGGEIMFALSGFDQIVPTNLQDAHFVGDEVVLAAEEFVDAWLIADSIGSSAPLLDSAGALVGFVEANGKIATPLHHFLPFVQASLRGGDLEYAGLGATVVHVGDVRNIDSSVGSGAEFGALVVAGQRGRAVVPGSPAAEAGIKAGDLIVSLDDVMIAGALTLPELLRTYDPGDTVSIELMRNGERMFMDVTLVNALDLVY